ncbi:MAG: hypothetical protein ACJ74Z_18605 [Bryobacteraceae bacterium]
MRGPAIWKLAGLGFIGFCAFSVAADKVNLAPMASEAAGFCGAFLGALAGRTINRRQKAGPGDSPGAAPPEAPEISRPSRERTSSLH